MNKNNNDFRYMHRGKHLSTLKDTDLKILKAVDQRGQGKEHALLMLHGFSSSPAVFRQMIPLLTHYDAIICPILPGHAETVQAFSKTKAEDWLEIAKAQYESLSRDYAKVDVLGLSLGGLLACHLSQHYSIHHLYLLAPALDLHLSLNFMLALAKTLLWLGFRQFRNAAGNLIDNKYPEISYSKAPITAIIEVLQYIKTFQWQPPSCPVDLFLGRHDEVVNSDLVAARFAQSSQATIHWLNQSAHVLPLDTDLESITQCMNANFKVQVQT